MTPFFNRVWASRPAGTDGRGFLILLWLWGVATVPSQALHPSTDGSDVDPAPTNAPLRQVTADRFELGGVRFDKKQKTAQFEAQVNMNEGLIEYLVVGAAGKLHESLLRTEIEPEHLHLAMLLLGAQIPPAEPVRSGGDGKIEGNPVQIRLTWKSGDQEMEVPAEDWIRNKATDSAMKRGAWTYLGSQIIRGTFMARRERSLVAIVTDPFALIGNPRQGHESDEIWFVRSPQVPTVGTRVLITLHIEARKKNQTRPPD